MKLMAQHALVSLPATIDNKNGVAGVAGNCSILPITIPTPTAVEIALAIRHAADAARVICMSLVFETDDDSQSRTIIDNAIRDAFLHSGGGAVMCAAQVISMNVK